MEKREFVEPRELRTSVDKLAALWEAPPPRFVRNFENAVYQLELPTGSGFLRLTPSSHHTVTEIASELRFAQHLKQAGIPVAQPIQSRAGSLVERIEVARESYTACVFEAVPGKTYEACTTVDHPTFFRNAGRRMAEIHTAGTGYRPDSEFVRFSWKEDRWVRFADLVPNTEIEAWRLHDELMEWLRSLPRDEECYGLIHGDFTIANLRIAGGWDVQLFDLDSCCYHWHAYEIAMFLHFFGARPAFRSAAYDGVLAGYDEVRPVTGKLTSQIPMFGKMRLLYSFLVFANEWGFEDLNETQEQYFALRRRLFVEDPTWPTLTWRSPRGGSRR